MAVKLEEVNRSLGIRIAYAEVAGERGNNRGKVIKIQTKKGAKTVDLKADERKDDYPSCMESRFVKMECCPMEVHQALA